MACSGVRHKLMRFERTGPHRQSDRRDKGAEEASPHSLDTEDATHFLRRCGVRPGCISACESRTSIENKTPPIGEPKATATPAALDAVNISLILTRRAAYQ